MNLVATVSATALKNESGRVLDDAQRGAVRVTSHGRVRAYLVPVELFDRWQALEDKLLAAAAGKAKSEGLLSPEATLAALKPRKHAATAPVATRRKVARKAAR